MAADTTPAPGEIACPDPSVHEKHQRQSAAASTAALYVTQGSPDKNSSGRATPLGADGKLSSRSAAQSLKYAQPHDLPSFPSRGGDSSAAGAAAMLAKDHKMKDLWQPEMSSAGSKAALLAHKDGGKLDLWHPTASSAGNSAATLAMRNKGLSPQIDRGYTETGRNNSLLAATKSHHEGRQRAGTMPAATTPPPAYPDSRNSGKNALNAAAVSHRASTRTAPDGWNSDANQAARVKNMHMDSAMFGEHPPVEPEVDEKRHQAALRASAVSMAKQMYDYQNRTGTGPGMGSDTSSLNVGSAGAETAHRRNQSTTSQTDIKEEAIKYIHLQDAAHKLAQERLAKVDKEMEPGRYREYYGYPSQSPKKSRLSVRGSRRGRKRASSEGQYFEDSDDEEQARRIRTQMSQLSTAQNTVDDKQRQEDRARLLAAAEKRVHARMHDMDEKVFLETGKPTQAMMDEWEEKARAKAEKDRVERNQHSGKTHIGGGKYMDQSEIEAIAAARLKPTLDELNDTAEKKRARDEAMRAEADRRETARMEEKMKSEETKAEFKRIREQDKATARKEKEDRKASERAEKEEAKARKSEDKRKSREQKREEVAAVAGGAALAEVAEGVKEEHETQEIIAEEPAKDPMGEPAKEPKEKGRGVFSKIADRFKKRGDEEKNAEEPGTVEQPAEREIAQTEAEPFVVVQPTEREIEQPPVTTTATEQDDDQPNDGAAAASPATLGLWVPAGGEVDLDRAVQEAGEEGKKTEFEDEDESPVGKNAAAVAGAAALGAIVAAGAMEMEHSRSREEVRDRSSEVSSLSTYETEDEELEPQAPLETDTSAEHAGAYNFAGPSPAVEKKPDLMRHISTIESSSGSEPESPDLTDSNDDEYIGRFEPRPTMVGELQEQGPERAEVDQVTEAPARDAPLVTSETAPAAAPVIFEEQQATEPKQDAPETFVAAAPVITQETPITPPATTEDRQLTSDSPVSPLHTGENEGNIVLVNRDAPPEAPHIFVAPQEEPAPESAAPAPVVKTAPTDAPAKPSSASQPADKEKEDKGQKGILGFFRKMKNKSKADNKLHKSSDPRSKSRASSANASEKSFQGGAKYTGATNGKDGSGGGKDDIITPVTTTTAGLEAEGQHGGTDGAIGDSQRISGLGGDPHATTATTTATQEREVSKPEHIGTDGPIGDSKHISGLGGDPRATSQSSFQRYDEELKDLDDVSSSGVDEEDVERGRGGRLTQKLGLVKDKQKAEGEAGNGKSAVGNTNSNGEDEQFEEARDHFDESLAPPPAFGGQAKSESPVRETRFSEQF